MPDMDTHAFTAALPHLAPALAVLLALALTLALASCLTPRAWWRRPNLRAFAVAGGGTLAFAALFLALFGQAGWLRPAPPVAPAALAAGAPIGIHGAAPIVGARYLAIDDLNMRDANGVRAPRVAVLRAGSTVTALGPVDGDWWRVSARVDGEAREGWASSLWLRRADERRSRR